MNNIHASRTTNRQLARLLAWARLMLAWIGAMLFSATPPRVTRRHMRRRYAFFDLDRMAHMVACLILIRACALAPRPARTRAPRSHAPVGFSRRTRPHGFVRSAIGSAMRRRLHHRNLHVRLTILTDALANLDRSARMLLPRLRRRFTRLSPIIAVRPPHDALRCAALQRAPAYADTS